MFSYYGAKGKIVNLYPKPLHDVVIEPFAGSARYALKYFDRDVILIDKYKTIIDVWRYLQTASEKDILGLPELKRGDSIDNYALADVEKDFLGFLVCNGLESPRRNVSSFEGVNVARDLQRTAKQLFKIRHWKLINGEFDCLDNIAATWFIDPPYVQGGEHYKCSSRKLDFAYLAEWSKTRNGQSIVCENSAASWLPFNKLAAMKGTLKTTTEVFWTNQKVEIQANLFGVENNAFFT